MILLEMFTYPFIVRAFVVGILVSVCAALLGVPLVLKRYSMIGDGLSHVSFGALSVAVACGWAPLPVSIPVVVIAALGLLRMTERSRLGADAAIAVVSASALAIGIIVTSLTTGMTTDVDSYMFGSILALSRADVALSIGVSAAVLVLFGLFYHQLFAITFDESFSRATGMKVGVYNTLLAVLTALTIVLGMRLMGAMLISSLVIFPALTAMRLKKSFFGVVILAGCLSVVCFCVGLIGSYLLSLPVGASVVVIGAGLGVIHAALAKLRGAAPVIVIDGQPSRLHMAREMAADHVIDFTKTDPVAEVMRLTGGVGADYVLEAVGRRETYEQAFAMLRKGGKLQSFGICSDEARASLPPAEFVLAEKKIGGSCAGIGHDWEVAIDLTAASIPGR